MRSTDRSETTRKGQVALRWRGAPPGIVNVICRWRRVRAGCAACLESNSRRRSHLRPSSTFSGNMAAFHLALLLSSATQAPPQQATAHPRKRTCNVGLRLDALHAYLPAGLGPCNQHLSENIMPCYRVIRGLAKASLGFILMNCHLA